MQIQHNELKTKFAELLLKNPKNNFKAALELCDNDACKALRCLNEFKWDKDPFVLSEKNRLMEEKGAKAFLPSKEELSHDILNDICEITDPDSKIKFYRLVAEINGMIEKPSLNIQNNIQNNNNRVMLVPHSLDVDTWEKLAQNQQNLLRNE